MASCFQNPQVGPCLFHHRWHRSVKRKEEGHRVGFVLLLAGDAGEDPPDLTFESKLQRSRSQGECK